MFTIDTTKCPGRRTYKNVHIDVIFRYGAVNSFRFNKHGYIIKGIAHNSETEMYFYLGKRYNQWIWVEMKYEDIQEPQLGGMLNSSWSAVALDEYEGLSRYCS